MPLPQLLAVQRRRPGRAPQPFSAASGAPPAALAAAAAAYAATGAASIALLAKLQV